MFHVFPDKSFPMFSPKSRIRMCPSGQASISHDDRIYLREIKGTEGQRLRTINGSCADLDAEWMRHRPRASASPHRRVKAFQFRANEAIIGSSREAGVPTHDQPVTRKNLLSLCPSVFFR